MSGNRSHYRDGRKLVTLHRPGTPYDDGEWALYDLRTDPTETTDIARDHPDVVKELAYDPALVARALREAAATFE